MFQENKVQEKDVWCHVNKDCRINLVSNLVLFSRPGGSIAWKYMSICVLPILSHPLSPNPTMAWFWSAQSCSLRPVWTIQHNLFVTVLAVNITTIQFYRNCDRFKIKMEPNLIWITPDLLVIVMSSLCTLMPCLVLSCPVLTFPVMSFPYPASSYPVWSLSSLSHPVWSLSCLVLPRLVLVLLILSYVFLVLLVLSCLAHTSARSFSWSCLARLCHFQTSQDVQL